MASVCNKDKQMSLNSIFSPVSGFQPQFTVADPLNTNRLWIIRAMYNVKNINEIYLLLMYTTNHRELNAS
jgi:hypothetical protein